MKNLFLFLLVFFASALNAQDNIILKNGNEIIGHIIKVGTSEIEYKKDSLSPVYAIKKSEVFMIKYSTGAKDVFSNLSTPAPQTNSNPALDELKMKYTKHRNIGIGLIVTSGVLFVAGSATVGISQMDGVNWRAREKSPIAGGVIMGVGLPIFIAGAIEFTRYTKYKIEWKKGQKSEVTFMPDAIHFNPLSKTYSTGATFTF